MRFKKGFSNLEWVGHHHGSDMPTSARAVLHHTDPNGSNILKGSVYGCFFHSFCASDLNFGTKNNGGMKYSTLKSVIFASY